MRNTLIVCMLMLAPVSARATLLFTLNSPIQTGAPGGRVAFSGTLFNSDVVDVFLNGASAILPYSELSVDFTDFFTLVPLSLAAGESYSGPIFSADITNAATMGDYFGSFTIQGGPDGNTVNDLATENFQVSISSVPEPSSGSLLGTILLMLGVAQFCRAR